MIFLIRNIRNYQKIAFVNIFGDFDYWKYNILSPLKWMTPKKICSLFVQVSKIGHYIQFKCHLFNILLALHCTAHDTNTI